MTEVRLLSIRETATRANCTVWCVRDWIWEGQLPYVQAGKRYLVDVTDLEKLIQRLKRREKS